MSVLVVTSLGDIVVDLYTDRCPLTAKNFLKLCKVKYYNGCLFHKVEKDFLAQTGDPSGTGDEGDSIYKVLYGDQARFFDDEIHPELKHKRTGTVAMASAGKNLNASQFYFTLGDDLDYLDGKHTVFGIVEEQEGLETLAKINEAYTDDRGRPYKNIRIKHTYVLDDPFSDPLQLSDFIPEKSPEGKPDNEKAPERLEDNWVPLDEKFGPVELEELIRSKEAHTNAAILESIGDIPDADIKPPENVLFVCKLNPVTQDEDLHTIFSRFGNVTSADIICDYKTGDSLCYAFIEFETKEACELAYTKMDNTLIDDRRIHVDFSQSVAKLWSQYRHGRRRESKGSGCFKCGASNHIAKDCPQDSKGKEKASKYILKDNRQRGGPQSYDMVFDDHDDNLGSRRQSQGDEIGHRSNKQKIAKQHCEDSGQKGSGRHISDSWNYQNSCDYVRREHRETDSRLGKRSGDDYRNDKGSRGRDAERHGRDPNRQRYKETSRHGKREDLGSKTNAVSSRLGGDKSMSRERRDAFDLLNIRNEKNRSGHSGGGKDCWDSRTSLDPENKERKMKRHGEERGWRHHERSRQWRDDGGSPELGHGDYDIRERKHRYEKRR